MKLTGEPGPWSEVEQRILLDATSKFGSVRGIVSYVMRNTERSEQSIVRRLHKVGYAPQLVGKYIAASNLGI